MFCILSDGLAAEHESLLVMWRVPHLGKLLTTRLDRGILADKEPSI
jgi:hypothetical protein